MEREKKRRVIVRVAVLAAAVVLAWALFFSPLLAVRDVRVIGARHTSVADVVDAAALDDGSNLLTLSGDAVTERVEQLPWIATARLDRKLPGTVRLRVTERRPAMVLSLGAARWTIDAAGRVLGSGASARGLPVLAGVQVGTIEPGGELATDEARDALAAYRTLPRPIRRRVVAVFAATIERITFSLDDGTQIRYGAAEQMTAKNEVLTILLRERPAEGATGGHIDVRVPQRPAVGR